MPALETIALYCTIIGGAYSVIQILGFSAECIKSVAEKKSKYEDFKSTFDKKILKSKKYLDLFQKIETSDVPEKDQKEFNNLMSEIKEVVKDLGLVKSFFENEQDYKIDEIEKLECKFIERFITIYPFLFIFFF